MSYDDYNDIKIHFNTTRSRSDCRKRTKESIFMLAAIGAVINIV